MTSFRQSFRFSRATILPAYRETQDLEEGPSPSELSSDVAPPRYSIVFGDPDEQVPEDLPNTQHDFWLTTGVFKSKAWAGLRVSTRPSTTKHRAPRIYGGDEVKGIVLLELPNPTTVNSIILYLKGRIVTGFTEEGSYTFLDQALEIWTKARSEPSSPSSPSFPPSTRRDGKVEAGSHEIPFSIPFPTNIDISAGYVGKGKKADRQPLVFFTPQTFLERHLSANIQYELVLVINHGLLRQYSKLKAPVIFIPEIRPDSPSAKRLASYVADAPLAGPVDDPDGWEALPSISIPGMFQGERAVVLEHTLYLARPLSYTRGTVIPCFLRLSCPDHRSLEGLSDPDSQCVRLGRRVTYSRDPNKTIDRYIRREAAARQSGGTSEKDDLITWEFDETETAVFWTPESTVKEPYVRWLEGEIHLAEELPPTSSFLPFTVEYHVEVMPYKSSLFRPTASQASRSVPVPALDGPSSQALSSYPVTIATCHHIDGPKARAYTQKRKTRAAKKRVKDEGDVVGWLADYGAPAAFAQISS